MIIFLFAIFINTQVFSQEKFPDGTPIPDWFRKNEVVNINSLGKIYRITDYGVINDSTIFFANHPKNIANIITDKFNNPHEFN